jgi:hypothetical protein
MRLIEGVGCRFENRSNLGPVDDRVPLGVLLSHPSGAEDPFGDNAGRVEMRGQHVQDRSTGYGNAHGLAGCGEARELLASGEV